MGMHSCYISILSIPFQFLKVETKTQINNDNKNHKQEF